MGIGSAIYDGIIFIAGNGTGAATIEVQVSNANSTRFDNCSLRIGSTGTGRIMHNTANTACVFNNTTVSFSATTQGILVSNASLKWTNTPGALIGAQVPSTLFAPAGGSSAEVECIGVDFSAAGSGKTLIGTATGLFRYRFIDCKLNAAVTKAAPTSLSSPETDFLRSGSAGVNYAVSRHRHTGTLTEETTIVRSGGASDGTTPLAWKIVTTADAYYLLPFECPPIAFWNDTTGSAKTATIECIGTAIATDQEVWLDLEFLGDASSPLASFVNDGKVDLLATAANQTTSSATWGGALTGKFKINVTFTAQQKGWIYARVKCAKASSTFYIDPLITLT
jgi:hypothetical protein